MPRYILVELSLEGVDVMGLGRKRSVLKMKRRKSQQKLKQRIKRKIEAAKK